MDWPADRVARRRVEVLVPSARNARLHSPEQIEQLKASIQQWGWTMPILVDEDHNVIAGHGRLLAAHELGYETVPTVTAKGWTEDQKRAYVIADNKLTENGNWDLELLQKELDELRKNDFDVSLIGFSVDELEQLQLPDMDAIQQYQGMPEFNQPDNHAYHTLQLHFESEQAIQDFAKLVGQKVTKGTLYLYYPKKAHDPWMDSQYKADE